MSISNDIVSTKIYDKRYHFDFVLYQWSRYSDVIEFDEFRTSNIVA